MVCNMYLFLLLSLCVTLCDGHYDNEDWTDPTDMFNYDAATGKMINPKPSTEVKTETVCEKGEDTCPGNNNAEVTNTGKVKPTTEEQKVKEDVKLPETNSNPVFRRYLRKVLSEAEHYGLPEDSSSEIYYNAEMVLSKQMVIEIQKFIDDDGWNLGAFEDTLIRSLVQFRSHNVKEWWTVIFEDYIGIDLGTTLKILLCITCLVSIIATELWSHIGWFTQLKRLCILSFFVSVAWNWLYLYKVAFAEQQAELAKQPKFDGSCGQKISWSESLFGWLKGASTFQNDPCEEYFKNLMINPALMVPPTKALALTFTDFITEPLKHIGKAMGEFLNGLLAEIPVFYQLLVLILIAAICLVACYGASTTFGQALMLRNNREAPQGRLPPAEPQRPYGNNIEYLPQPPPYPGPGYPPVYLQNSGYSRNQRPENLQAIDVSHDRHNMHLANFTDVDFPLRDEYGGQRNEEFIKRSTEETAGVTEQSSERTHQRKEELPKERSYSPQLRRKEPTLESFAGQLQRKEEPIEQKSVTEHHRKPENIHTTQSNTELLHERSSAQEHKEVETVEHNSYGDHERKEETLPDPAPPQPQRRKDSKEEKSHKEAAWKERPDKSLERKDMFKGDSSEENADGEEEATGSESPIRHRTTQPS
ncbi:chloride channel CLIC-like protein 1 isoform 2-T3 [Anomaloglossus baeobatrachus]|uniref:chloride channel CLIC-like protein 1 isoform X2 n=1 Tax=Anomaloglossus baeobatrachus TaxID=238106 RepID=UPI003F50AF5F